MKLILWQIYKFYASVLYSQLIFRLDLANGMVCCIVFSVLILMTIMIQEDWKTIFQSSWTMMVNRISPENVAADHSNKPNPKL